MSEGSSRAGNRLLLALGLTAVVLVIELAGGLLSHSLALLSDAGHVLTDVFALGLAWFAVSQGERPADARRTYGYQRVEILAAMVNGATLILLVGGIGYEAARRFLHPEPVTGGIVIVSALAGIAINAFVGFRLHNAGGGINVRAAMLHVVGDIASSVGVVVAGALILLTGWLFIDPLLSIAIAALIAWGALRIVIQTVDILLESTPRGMKLRDVQSEILSSAGVDGVHDLHVWSLSPEEVALSAHLVLSERSLADAEHLVADLSSRLDKRFRIGHTTIQVEYCHPCKDDLHGGAPEELIIRSPGS
ncbi:MAG: cation transporter [Chloroflexi bacterium]|nr:MAG: cation transporter [Chloroflexota bacterium]